MGSRYVDSVGGVDSVDSVGGVACESGGTGGEISGARGILGEVTSGSSSSTPLLRFWVIASDLSCIQIPHGQNGLARTLIFGKPKNPKFGI